MADMAFSGPEKKSTVINDYAINTDVKTTIGKGAYGIVYKAKDLNNETVAAKRIDGKVHPGILTQDGDLNDFFYQRRLSLSDKLELMSAIAKGIGYLHTNNIIHRDIKPGNIIIASDSPLVPKLTKKKSQLKDKASL